MRASNIHGRGIFAAATIPKETRIIEYVGERLRKKEGDERALLQLELAEQTGDAAVYVFTLSKKWDLDGNVDWNLARLMNHSCEPNCEARIEKQRIFIYALRDIKKGEELTYDYGFDIECYEDHPCRCGRDGCIGYIVSREQWPVLRKLIKEEEGFYGM